MADIVVDDLRKWKMWQNTETILVLSKRQLQQQRLLERSILRYMLSCPHGQFPKAKEYVDKIKKEHPDQIEDALEVLKIEKEQK